MMKHISAKRALIILAALLICLLIFIPMRIVLGMSDLEERGMSAKAVEGSIWSGRLRELHIGKLPLGDVSARLRAPPLLTGKTEIVINGKQSASSPALHAVIGGNDDVLIARNVTADIATRGIFAPVPVSNIQLENVNAEMRDGKCVEASGTVRVNVQQSLLGMNLSRGLSGKIACRYGALYVPLAGQSGLERLDLTIKEGGRYEAVFKVEGSPADMTGILGRLGFTPKGKTMVLTTKGQF
ncbi:type II secretion system protein N [Sphingorhabdus sp. Alg239-R122]|uniref:type II secretion system protein N n=1 Tax=Sphingorhabdus sp. Alg239-R122 TaxID=2305989 RepID=UPI0013DB8C4D|nr:type II secretion system protein N [Sphingorhabdus sp. Alg239-R122]